MWQLPAQKDINEIAQLEAQPAHFSDAFKNSHAGSCGKQNTGPQLSLCQDNSHGYSHLRSSSPAFCCTTQTLILSLRCLKKGLAGTARPRAQGRRAWRWGDSWLHNGCLGQAALPSLAHLLPCSWFNDRKHSPRYPGPAASASCRTARAVPCAGRGRPPRGDTPRHLPKKQKREKQSQLGPRAESRPDGRKKKQTGQTYRNVAPEGHRSSAQNTGSHLAGPRTTSRPPVEVFKSGLPQPGLYATKKTSYLT